MPNNTPNALILRLVDPLAPPQYGANIRWCCTYCRSAALGGLENFNRMLSETARQLDANLDNME
jgi:hypothetical protein